MSAHRFVHPRLLLGILHSNSVSRKASPLARRSSRQASRQSGREPVCRIASQPHLHKERPDDGEEARQEQAIHLSRVQRRRLTVYSVGTNMENLLALATRIAGRADNAAPRCAFAGILRCNYTYKRVLGVS